MTTIPPGGVSSIQGVSPTGTAGKANQAGSAKSTNEFSDLFKKVVGQANDQMQEASSSVEQLAQGKSDDLQNVVMSMAKADLSFRFILEIRNKLMDAYQEIMRMQV